LSDPAQNFVYRFCALLAGGGHDRLSLRIRMLATRFLQGAVTCANLAALLALPSCGSLPSGGGSRERECMARVMYFESNRSSAEGMLAVGTVVMNRVESDKFPNSVCAVVGQKNQFAPGVLSKPMKEGRSKELAERVADQVLGGKRHRGVGKAMFFHTAGYNFPYKNMHYMVIAGGNAFYDKRNPPAGGRNRTQMEVAAATPRARPAAAVQVATYRPPPVPQAPAAPPPPVPQTPAWSADPLLAAVPQVAPPLSIEELIFLDGG
jgi:spore germination cell wall hydrolase CwlJ-like protein